MASLIQDLEFVDQVAECSEVVWRDAFDLPADLVTLAITLLVLRGSFQQQMICMDIDLDRPSQRRNRQVDADVRAVGQAQKPMLRLDRDASLTQPLRYGTRSGDPVRGIYGLMLPRAGTAWRAMVVSQLGWMPTASVNPAARVMTMPLAHGTTMVSPVASLSDMYILTMIRR